MAHNHLINNHVINCHVYLARAFRQAQVHLRQYVAGTHSFIYRGIHLRTYSFAYTHFTSSLRAGKPTVFKTSAHHYPVNGPQIPTRSCRCYRIFIHSAVTCRGRSLTTLFPSEQYTSPSFIPPFILSRPSYRHWRQPVNLDVNPVCQIALSGARYLKPLGTSTSFFDLPHTACSFLLPPLSSSRIPNGGILRVHRHRQR